MRIVSQPSKNQKLTHSMGKSGWSQAFLMPISTAVASPPFFAQRLLSRIQQEQVARFSLSVFFLSRDGNGNGNGNRNTTNDTTSKYKLEANLFSVAGAMNIADLANPVAPNGGEENGTLVNEKWDSFALAPIDNPAFPNDYFLFTAWSNYPGIGIYGNKTCVPDIDATELGDELQAGKKVNNCSTMLKPSEGVVQNGRVVKRQLMSFRDG
ncbi:hypothetical protein BDP27DRAFT_1406869 [Rhodocollybia butyracea]|uniref:Uncharacterized protein n=1 Tax=Rhodocollybia butyracea TaxID=206335 RepID=A0A9P5PCW3_9AGAR|nr:hypothetical protein BDP27DRAFT_1406869 [Rhodocollybia butyracea]